MNYNKINFLFKEKKIKIGKFCQEIGITEQGLRKSIQNNSMSINTIEKIANALEVPVTYFFSDEVKIPERNFFNKSSVAIGHGNAVNSTLNNNDMLQQKILLLEIENSSLKELLKSKDEIIELLKQKKK